MTTPLGALEPITVEVRDAARVLTNASTTNLVITLPDLTTVNPGMTNPSPGTYQYDYPTVQAGRHTWRFTSTGPQTAQTGEFNVSPADPGYIISLADAKKHLNKTTTADDDEIRGFLEAVTVVAEYHCGPVVARSHTDRLGSGWLSSASSLVLHRAPVISVTSVTSVPTPATTWLTAALDVNKTAGIVRLLAGTTFTSGPWDVAYVAGRAVIPANVTRGALVVLDHLWETQRGPSTARRPPLGGEEFLEVPGLSFAVPRRAVELFQATPTIAGLA